jgi:hypothetical protein
MYLLPFIVVLWAHIKPILEVNLKIIGKPHILISSQQYLSWSL